MSDKERLIELFEAVEKDPAITCPHYKTVKTCDTCKYTINNYLCNHTERMIDYLLANGVIVPPCKVGTKVYFAGRDSGECLNGNLVSYCLDAAHLWFNCHYDCGLNYWHPIEDFGKTVFLTKEEAEQALKEREG